MFLYKYAAKMKSGFTLVELMIVIAVIALLSAALYPSYLQYLAKSRDSSRVTKIAELSRGIITYFSDNGNQYPQTAIDCNLALQIEKYFNVFPIDTISTHDHGCGKNGFFGYGTGEYINAPHFVVTAAMEAKKSGNYNATALTNPLTGALDTADFTIVNSGLIPGQGQLYVFFQ